MNIDGLTMFALLMVPLFINEQVNGDGYTLEDIVMGNLSNLSSLGAIICMGEALKCGKAAHV
jgi:hypothetical protein